MKLTAIGSAAALTLLLFGAGEATESIMDYFGPLQEGKTFLFKVSNILITGIPEKREHVIKVILDKTTRIETEETIGNATPRTIRYELDPKQDAIYKKDTTTSADILLLKGPPHAGTTWQRKFFMTKNGAVTDAPTGLCRIAQIAKKPVLGKERDCLQVICQVDGKQTSVHTDESYCKGVGQIENTFTITYKNSQQKPFTHSEKLIEIK